MHIYAPPVLFRAFKISVRVGKNEIKNNFAYNVLNITARKIRPMIIDALSTFCVRHDIITGEDLPMFRYCIEKRFYSAVVFLPLFLFGVIWTNFATTVAFLGAFSYLRSTTNGFHAPKPGICFICSILIEFILFKFVIPLLNKPNVIVALCISIFTVFLLAPYNHPNMDLTPEEIAACRTSSRIRMAQLLLILFISSILSWADFAIGLFLGIALVSVLLILAYITNWEEFKCLTKKKNS